MTVPHVVVEVPYEGAVRVDFRCAAAERDRLLEHLRAEGLTDALLEFVVRTDRFSEMLNDADRDSP